MILVSGGTGLVGEHLLDELLNENKSIRAIHRRSSSIAPRFQNHKNIEWMECDVLDPEGLNKAFNDVRQVYHCAAIVSYLPADREKMRKINVEGTANMVNIALERGVEKFLHVSSIAAIGRSKEKSSIDESVEWENSKLNSNYAQSKFQSEMEVWRGSAEGLPVVVVNPSIVLGKGNYQKGTGRFFSMVNRGLRLYPTGATGFVGAKDLAIIMQKLMESEIVQERFIINSENRSYKSVFDKIAEGLKRKKPNIKLSPFLGECAWRAEKWLSKVTGKEPRGTKETVRLSMASWTYCNSKVRESLNFEFQPMDEVIDEVLLHFKSQQT